MIFDTSITAHLSSENEHSLPSTKPQLAVIYAFTIMARQMDCRLPDIGEKPYIDKELFKLEITIKQI